MSKRYTIEQQGSRWVASDGTAHFEGEEPDEAFDELMLARDSGEAGRAYLEHHRPIERAGDQLCSTLLGLIRVTALLAPPSVVRDYGRLIVEQIEEWAAVREEMGEGK